MLFSFKNDDRLFNCKGKVKLQQQFICSSSHFSIKNHKLVYQKSVRNHYTVEYAFAFAREATISKVLQFNGNNRIQCC